MHRTIEIAVSSASAPRLAAKLQRIEGVVGLNHMPGASLMPAGDVIVVHVLNRGADAVLKAVSDEELSEPLSVVTAELASINDSEHQSAIDDDVDEAI